MVCTRPVVRTKASKRENRQPVDILVIRQGGDVDIKIISAPVPGNRNAAGVPGIPWKGGNGIDAGRMID